MREIPIQVPTNGQRPAQGVAFTPDRNSASDRDFASDGDFQPDGNLARPNSEKGPARGGGPAARDLIPRRRDRWGNRLLWRYVMGTPITEDRPLAETPLAETLELVSQYHPLLALRLHHFHDQRLLPTLRRHAAIRREEEAALEGARARTDSANAAIDRHLSVLRRQSEKRDEESLHHEAKLAALAARLASAEEEAAQKVAAAGGQYDAEKLGEECALHLAPPTLEEVAASAGLPWAPGDAKAVLPGWLSWTMTSLVGVMIGVSLGIMAGLLPVDAIMRHPVIGGLCALIGIAAAAGGKQAIMLGHRQASERAYLKLPWPRRAAFVALALAVDVVLILIDSVVEREGLLANMRLRDMTAALSGQGDTGSESHGDTYFLAAILVNFGYVISAAWEGYYKGRTHVILGCLQARRSAIAARMEAERRARPEVQAALAAMAEVCRLRRERDQALLSRAEEEAALASRIAALEAARPASPELSEEAKRRIQDTWDDVCGCQEVFDVLHAQAMREWQRANAWWRRLGRAASRRAERRLE